MTTDTPLDLYADGACSKDRRGGWAWVLVDPATDEEISTRAGGEIDTTNQRMELTAAKMGLSEARTYSTDLTVWSDSAYLINCFLDDWRSSWEARGWKNSKKRDVENQDLWKSLFLIVDVHKGAGGRLEWRHVKGHNGHTWNERADVLAVAAKPAKTAGLL